MGERGMIIGSYKLFVDSGESGKENSLFGATPVSLEDTAT